MLRLKNITKTYKTGSFSQKALDNISLEFRKSEFVSILGPSGSGKTTLLNIIGGLDRYDSGDLIINNKSTKNFRDRDWDRYRNNCIGFIFQSYNLISHINIIENVEMAMTLSGVSVKRRRKKALEVLKKVHLEDHIHKKPNQLSGGQMQRVAIARALVNNPEIILADEPTGALDSKTSVEILDLLKEISKEKLVIMVTHNSEFAYQYSNRIIELKDGKIINDTNKIEDSELSNEKYNIRKTSMSFLTALKLSFKNIITKKGRTIVTAFASSIGIIGIALVLSLSNGFDIQIDKFEVNTLSSLPVMVSEQTMNVNIDQLREQRKDTLAKKEFPSQKEVYFYDISQETMIHTNNITNEYVEYVNKIDPSLLEGISYTNIIGMNILSKVGDTIKIVNFNQTEFMPIPKTLDNNKKSYLEKNYDLLAGNLPKNMNDLIIVADTKNRVNKSVLEALGFDASKKLVSFDQLLGKELKLVLNDQYYVESGPFFLPNQNVVGMYNDQNTITLKIVGIVRGNEDNFIAKNMSGGYLSYTDQLIDYLMEKNSNSKIVLKQKDANYNVLTGEAIDINTLEGTKAKKQILSYLGYESVPFMISLYPVDFDAKEAIVKYLDDYNKGKEENEKIVYTDLADTISNLSSGIMDAITIVLISFSSISLIVSSIMIGIITYISVLERTKEIGILRALGARRKDITRVFNAETFIIGITSGLLGILIARLLLFVANPILYKLTDLKDVAQMNYLHAIMLIVVSVTLTVIGGFIPAKVASKKDPVIALRTE